MPRLIFELALVGVIIVLIVALAKACKGDRFEGAANFGQALSHAIGAVGLVAAGFWLVLSEDWAPRTSLTMATTVKPIAGSNPKAAVLQIAAALKNDGKLKQTFRYRAFVVRGFDPMTTGPTVHGDLATKPLGQRVDRGVLRLFPGETDFSYSEFRVPCTQRLVQAFVDIEEPDHISKSTKPLSYERKELVSLDDACKV